MNFSEVFKLSNQLCRFSPNGKYLVSVRGGDWLGSGCYEGGTGTLLDISVTSCAVSRLRSVHSTVPYRWGEGRVSPQGGGRSALIHTAGMW